MKVLIISDMHGSGYYAEKIKEIEEKADNFDEDFVKYVTGQIGFVRALCYIRLTSLCQGCGRKESLGSNWRDTYR